MSESKKKKIVVVEDAKGIARGYKILLQQLDYDVTVRLSGEDVQNLVDKGHKFDLAIMDVVLPLEDLKNLKLEDCQETGLRLMESMIENNTCRRFYVITVRNDLKERIEMLCKEKKAVLKFEYKLDHEPKEFVPNVATLLSMDILE